MSEPGKAVTRKRHRQQPPPAARHRRKKRDGDDQRGAGIMKRARFRPRMFAKVERPEFGERPKGPGGHLTPSCRTAASVLATWSFQSISLWTVTIFPSRPMT